MPYINVHVYFRRDVFVFKSYNNSNVESLLERTDRQCVTSSTSLIKMNLQTVSEHNVQGICIMPFQITNEFICVSVYRITD